MLPSMRDKASGLLQVSEEIHIYLLPPGIPINYDSPTKFFRSNDKDYLLKILNEELASHSLNWKNIVIEEFEFHEFHKGLVPVDELWREFTQDGVMKTPLEKAKGCS
jgi:hypothetical protein